MLRPLVRELVEVEDDCLCCGAVGAYALFNPKLATAIRSRTLSFREAARADVVASANPGCSMHLTAAGVVTRHPMELVDAALGHTRL